MKLIDANILIRYLLNDHPEMSAKAKEIMLNNTILILTQVIAEVVYVLSGVYNIERVNIATALLKVSEIPNVHLENNDVVLLAMNEFRNSNLDFVDELLYAYHQVYGYPVETFDKKLNRKLNLAQP